ALSYRAIHIDVKHHLEKTDYYYKLIDKLARYKINAIIAEVEDKIKYQRQPDVGSADALSIEEWKKLSDYAWERNIEISPLVQGLGHASFILKHDKYKNLRDDPESDWAFNPLDPETYKVQFDLYLDAIEATPYGRYLHVGGDEVHTTGRNSGKSPLELQLIWLNKVCKFAEEHGRIPIFWDDMPLKQAGVYQPMYKPDLSEEEVNKIWEKNEKNLLEFLDQFPKNCVYMRWNYSSPEAIGNGKAMEWFRNNGMQVMGATAGQTRWVLMPQNESNMENIKSFALSSINSGINGLLLTLWDDDSPHFELYWRGIVAFSEYTWAGESRSKELIKTAYRQREFSAAVSNSEYSFIDQLEGCIVKKIYQE
ncbi:family 20 glycosylhydrolase, partial [Bacteroidota bacterium]